MYICIVSLYSTRGHGLWRLRGWREVLRRVVVGAGLNCKPRSAAGRAFLIEMLLLEWEPYSSVRGVCCSQAQSNP